MRNAENDDGVYVNHVEYRVIEGHCPGGRNLEDDDLIHVDHVQILLGVKNLKDDDMVDVDHVKFRCNRRNLEDDRLRGPRETSSGREKPRGR